MDFVKSLSMFHVDAKEIPCVTGNGAPTEKTEGAPGALYMDTLTGELYKCRAADLVHEVFTWEAQEGSGYKLPIGGEQLGGVKNGGNVVINEDGTMTAPSSGASQNGHTPVKGVDYWTEEDQESIVQQVITALGTPVFGTVDADNNIILTGNLADGIYTLKYEDAGGEQTEIGTVEIGGPAYTNLANPTSADWLTDKRFSTSSIDNSPGAYITNHIPCKPGDTIRMKGVDVVSNISSSPARTRMFDDGDSVGISDYYVKSLITAGYGSFDSETGITTFRLLNVSQNDGSADGSEITEYTFNSIRQNFKLMDGYTVNDVVITVNEEIV